MTVLTRDQAGYISDRADSATEGPWSYREECWFRYAVDGPNGSDIVTASKYPQDQYGFRTEQDARFTAAARTDIPDLCATVEYLYDKIAALEAELKAK